MAAGRVVNSPPGSGDESNLPLFMRKNPFKEYPSDKPQRPSQSAFDDPKLFSTPDDEKVADPLDSLANRLTPQPRPQGPEGSTWADPELFSDPPAHSASPPSRLRKKVSVPRKMLPRKDAPRGQPRSATISSKASDSGTRSNSPAPKKTSPQNTSPQIPNPSGTYKMYSDVSSTQPDDDEDEQHTNQGGQQTDKQDHPVDEDVDSIHSKEEGHTNQGEQQADNRGHPDEDDVDSIHSKTEGEGPGHTGEVDLHTTNSPETTGMPKSQNRVDGSTQTAPMPSEPPRDRPQPTGLGPEPVPPKPLGRTKTTARNSQNDTQNHQSSNDDRGPDAPSPNPSGPSPKKRPFPDDEYTLRMSHAWNLSDSTWNPIPVNKRAKANVPRSSYIQHTHRAANGLTNLQLAHNAPISHCAMDVATEHVWNMLPDILRRFILVLPPNGPALWSTDQDHLDGMYEKMKQDVYQVADPMGNKQFTSHAQFKKRPWVIWPIWVEDQFGSDWVTIFWYSVPSKPSEDGKAPAFDDISMYSIIDPRRETYTDGMGRHRPIQERTKRIAKRLHDFLTPGGFSMEHAVYKEILCPPMPQTEATSGERCYHVTKDLTRQLLERWLIAGGQQPQYHENTIQHIAKWVNPFGERIEMTGINAWQLMASFDYNARISVEALSRNQKINVVADGKKKYLYNLSLSGPFGEHLIADHDFALPNEGNYNGPPKPEDRQQQPKPQPKRQAKSQPPENEKKTEKKPEEKTETKSKRGWNPFAASA